MSRYNPRELGTIEFDINPNAAEPAPFEETYTFAEVEAMKAEAAEYEAEKAYAAKLAAETELLAEEWREKWPNACITCYGWGGSWTAATRWQPADFDDCLGIKDVTICHRCGTLGLSEDGEGPCSKCGWNFDDGEPFL